MAKEVLKHPLIIRQHGPKTSNHLLFATGRLLECVLGIHYTAFKSSKLQSLDSISTHVWWIWLPFPEGSRFQGSAACRAAVFNGTFWHGDRSSLDHLCLFSGWIPTCILLDNHQRELRSDPPYLAEIGRLQFNVMPTNMVIVGLIMDVSFWIPFRKFVL